jgi:hypothetical protein
MTFISIRKQEVLAKANCKVSVCDDHAIRQSIRKQEVLEYAYCNMSAFEDQSMTCISV